MSKLSIRGACVSLALAMAASRCLPAPAQTVPSSSDAKNISVLAVVSDKHGAPVPNLKREDFQLQADRKLQTITAFSPARELPLTVGLVINSSPAQRDELQQERTASLAFLQALLTDADRTRAFVVQFGRDVDLLQDTTGSREQIRAAIEQLETDRDTRVEPVSSSDSRRNSQTDPPNGRYPGNSPGTADRRAAEQSRRANNALYDALFLSSDEITRKQSGRKVLIVLSDGDDSGSRESLTSAIQAAQRSDTVVYAVYFKERRPSDRTSFSVGRPDYCNSYPGSYPYPGGYPDQCSPRLPETAGPPDGRKTLERICAETGGRMFEAGKKESLSDIYKHIADELNAQYALSFAPDKDASSKGYHHLLLTAGKLGSKDLAVQTRDGYYIGD